MNQRSKNALILIATILNITSASIIGRSAIIVGEQHSYIDSNLSWFVKSFVNEANKRNKTIDLSYVSVQFSNKLDNDTEVIGFCRVVGPVKLIKINASYWSSATYSEREELIFHEMAHCLLKREHCNEKTDDGSRYVSIMSEYSGSKIEYMANREEYVEELFSKHARCK